MRRLRYMLLAFVALLSALACVRELPVVDPEFVEEAFPEGEPVTITFSLPAEAQTKVLDENGTLNTLHIAVFGSSGYLKEYVKAEDKGAGTATTYKDPYGHIRDNVPVRNFAVTLTLSEKPRILHFIGNGPATLPFDADTTILSTLMSESGGQGFWQVKRVKSIGAQKDSHGQYIKDGNGNYMADQAIQDSLTLVPLIRNWSKLSILTEAESGFIPKSFAVVNVPDKGTIAPMCRILGSQGQDSLVFVECYDTLSFETLERRGYPASLPNDARFVHTVPTKQDFINCTGGVVNYNSGAGATYLYERPIPSNDLEPTFIIAYGTFAGDGKDYFYRIDLADKDGYYPVYRNFWYCINIQKIESVGHLTPEAAAQSSGGVNVSADVVTSHLGDISDGIARLVVQPWMTQTFPSQQIDNTILHAKFFDNLASADPVMDFNAVTVEARDMEDDPSHPVITSCSIGPASTEGAGTEIGWRTITFSTAEPDPVKARTQILRVTAHYDQAGVPKTLYRDVEITLLPLQEMEVFCAQETIPRGIGKNQTLYISLPDGLLESMFPLNFVIEAENLSLMPAVGTNLPVIAGMSISDDGERKGEQSFYFAWTLSWDDYQAVTPVQSVSDDEKYLRIFSCDFVTTRALSATTIWVANEFFHKARTKFENSGLTNLPYFYVEATDANGCTVTINQNGLQYQVDNDGWINYTAKDLIPLEEGEKLYIRAGSATSPVKDWSGAAKFNCTGSFNLGGNLASLVIGEDFAQGADLTTLAPGWKFAYLFQNEKGLQKASALEIPMTAMTTEGFQYLFDGCTNLTEPPALPSTTLAQSCYKCMFKGCSLMKTAPALPARTLAISCYDQMFVNCTALTKAPTLPAETLVASCYNNMFNNCTRLKEIAMMATDVSASNSMSNWVKNVPGGGTFYRNPKMLGLKNGVSSVPTNWNLLPWDEFRIEVLSPGTVSYSATDMEYSLNWGEWMDYTAGVELAVGDNVRFRSTAPVLAPCAGTFSSTVDFIAAGNSMSLVAGEDYRTETSVPDNAFKGLFANNSRLKSVTSLDMPAQTLGTACYQEMFKNCTGLTVAPALPATTLSADCYKEMFAGCSNLRVVICDAVDISASNCTQNWLQGVKGTGLLGGNHYKTVWETESNSGIPHGWAASNYFFVKALANGANVQLARDCSISYNGLDWIAYTANTFVNLDLGKPVYFKAGSASDLHKDWGSGQGARCLVVAGAYVELGGSLASLVAGDDFVTEGAGLTGYTFGNFCLNNGQVREAVHLEFPMLTCEEGCYKSFFDGCTNLLHAPEVLPATTLVSTCYRNMFYKCSSMLTGPVLPATTIVANCYQRMFWGCSSLTWVKMMSTNYIESAFKSDSNDGWMQGVPTGNTAQQKGCTFVKNVSNTTIPTNSKFGIPEGWTIQTATP